MDKALPLSCLACLTAGEASQVFMPPLYLFTFCICDLLSSLRRCTSLYAVLTTDHIDDMPTTGRQASARNNGVKTSKLARETASQPSTELTLPNSNILSTGFGDLDEQTLLSLSMDAPVQLSPPAINTLLISDSSPTPLSKMRVASEVMDATLERLGFGPPNDLSTLPILLSPTPADSEVTGTSSHEEKAEPTAEGKAPTSEVSGADVSDAYGQITGLFQQISQMTGHSLHTLIIEWALLYAHTDMVKRRTAHGRMPNTTTADQQTFEEEVNKAINLVE